MSRCFPFPPPGYERKARNEDNELLEKEKLREKKHRKEKKDKEKREGKEKREKDRGDSKQKDKKDKKEKSKDREKKKDADKAKEKTKIPEEKRFSGQSDAHVAEKLGQKEITEKNNCVEKKVSQQIKAHKPEKPSQINNAIDDSKFVKEFDRRIKDETAGLGNISAGDRRKDEGMLRLVTKGSKTLAPVRKNDKRMEDKMVHNKLEELPRLVDKSVERKFEGSEKTNEDRENDETRGVRTVPSTDAMVHSKLEGLPRLLDTSVETKLGEGEKTKKDREGFRSLEKDKEKKSHGKDKDRDREKKREEREKRKEDKQKKREDKQRKKEDKEKKKEKEKAKNAEHVEKAKEIPQLKNVEPEKTRGTEKHDLVNNHVIKPLVLPNTHGNAPTDGNPKKRKDFETNGISHASDNLPSKVPRAMPASSHPPLENGRALEHSQTTILPPVKKLPSNNIKAEIKDCKINGVTEAQLSPVSSTKVKHEKTVVELAKPLVKPPHPDTRFLSLIYSVPVLEERLDLNDQDWLLKPDASRPKKFKVDPSGSEEIPQVWDEAREIASADIFALPYVIPY